MFRLSTRTTLALTLATVTGLFVPAAQAGDDDRGRRDDSRHKDGRWERNDREKRGRDDRRHDNHHGDHRFGGISIRIGTPPVIVRERVVIARPQPVVVQPCDEMPADLHIAAYQSQDRVIILITGNNRSAGYTTCLTEVDASCEVPTVKLRNTVPECATAQCVTGFTLSAAIRSHRPLGTVRVLVAGRTVDVPVTSVPMLS